MIVKNLKKFNIPKSPGVYFFLKGSKILYIGKATSLKDRVKSYFSKDLIKTRGVLTTQMVALANNLRWEKADTVLEALILEANLIKAHQPHYNVREKDDKSWNYVCITKEKLPKVMMVRGRSLKHEEFKNVYGPYTNGSQLNEAMKIIRRIFPFLDEKSKNYIEFYRQINLAPDLNDTRMYLQNIKNIKLFLAGKKRQILNNLKKEMSAFAKKREFEKAGEVKRQIFALKHINDIALIKDPLPTSPLAGGGVRIEAYDIAHMSGRNIVGVMTVIEGNSPNKNEYRKFRIRSQAGANDTGALTEVLLRRFNHPEWRMPDFIVVDGSTAQINAAQAALKKVGLKIPVVAVVKDEKHKAREVLGDQEIIKKYRSLIVLINSEAHRFGIAYHKNLRGRNFLK